MQDQRKTTKSINLKQIRFLLSSVSNFRRLPALPNEKLPGIWYIRIVLIFLKCKDAFISISFQSVFIFNVLFLKGHYKPLARALIIEIENILSWYFKTLQVMASNCNNRCSTNTEMGNCWKIENYANIKKKNSRHWVSSPRTRYRSLIWYFYNGQIFANTFKNICTK